MEPIPAFALKTAHTFAMKIWRLFLILSSAAALKAQHL
jgi:hypothetical protein